MFKLHQNHQLALSSLQETRQAVAPIVHNTSVSDNPVNDTNIITTPNTTTGSVARPETAIEGSAIITGWTRLKAMPGMSGLTGAGSLICVIDSGISYNSPEFGSCTGVGEPRGQCKVVTGYDFVGDSYNGRLDGPAAVRGGPPVSQTPEERNGMKAADLTGKLQIASAGSAVLQHFQQDHLVQLRDPASL